MANKEFNDVQLDVTFTAADSRANIASQENISLSFGKLAVWYNALVPTGGSSGQFLGWNSSGTAKWVNNPNTDTKVKQTPTSGTDYRPLLIGYASSATAGFSPSEVTQQAYVSQKIFVKPSTGDITLYSPDSGDTPGIIFQRGTFTDSSLDWKIYNSSGVLMMDRTVAGDSTSWQNKFKVDGTAAYYGGSRLALQSEIKTYSAGTGLSLSGTTFNHSASITADTTSSASPSHGDTFTVVDSVTRDSTGHVTTLNTKTITLPADQNTDTKVNVTLATTTKAYLLATSTTPTSTAQAVTSVSDTGVYLGTAAGMLCANGTICANTSNSSTAGGLALYSTDPETYGIMFRGTTNSGKHGYVQSDWATYFTMNAGATTRGWIFRKKTDGPVASISGAGHAVFNGSVTVGGNAANTSGCRMVYTTSTETLDFVFA